MTLPTVGGSENTWGTILNAHINIGHNTDGTHNQEDWTPTSYAGEESITFPNGLILKQGVESIAADTTDDVTYAVAFPTAFVNGWATYAESAASLTHPCTIQAKSGSETTVVQVTNGDDSLHTVRWYAIGY